MTFTDNQPDPERTVTLSRKQIKQLEADAKEGREAKERVAQLERERAFAVAGVPLDDKRAGYFVAGYQGDQTPEAIKAEWDNTFGPGQGHQQHGSPIDAEINALNGAMQGAEGGQNLPPNQLAQRNQELAALSDTDPKYDQKFRSIMERYGSQVYNPNTG